jgi:hypothetical protein
LKYHAHWSIQRDEKEWPFEISRALFYRDEKEWPFEISRALTGKEWPFEISHWSRETIRSGRLNALVYIRGVKGVVVRNITRTDLDEKEWYM